MSFIKLKDICKSYRNGLEELPVLQGINLEIDQGKIISIIGASGAGKSTLLHILGTLDRPSRGEVWFGGQNLSLSSDRELAMFRNQKIGFVFQFHHLLPEFTALENVMMPILINRKNYHEAKIRAQELLEEVGLKGREGHKPGELSGGEQQRVAIARALVNNPELLLADEPTGNLDSKTSEKIYSVFYSLNQRRNITVVLVTHNESLGRRTDHSLKLAEGSLQEVNLKDL